MRPRVFRVIREADVVVMVVDARDISGTTCNSIERQIKIQGKMLVLVVNKIDLVSKVRVPLSVIKVSAKKRTGLRKLRQALAMASRRLGKQIKVGVVGYANTGKSSIISALKGKQSARVSPKPGFTRGVQFVRISKNIILIDSPGEIPRKENETSLVLKGAFDVTKVKDPEGAAVELVQRLGLSAVTKHYVLKKCSDEWELLEVLAGKWNFLLRGGRPDTDRAARRLLNHWQKGELRQ